MIKNLNIDLIYQPFIDNPPITTEQMHQAGISNDRVTITTWYDTWIKQYKTSVDLFKDFGEKSVGKLHNINVHRPCIVIGSGPSLKDSIDALKMNQGLPTPVMTISCLHNMGYFDDEGIYPDYYLTLDPGQIIIKDVWEGRNKTEKEYWEGTKNKKLLATVFTPPELFEKWQGEVYLFNSTIPDFELVKTLESIQVFRHYVSSGGNALGACMYVGKVIFGSSTIIYVGADYCFDYDNTFHSYKTSYDQIGQYITHPDVFGIPRKTWTSYLNFKFNADKVALTVPGEWISASFGTLGAYLGGNIRAFKYADLATVLEPYKIPYTVTVERFGPDKKVLAKDSIDLAELFKNPQYERAVTLF